MNKYDVVVIGSGVGGLVCAHELSKKHKVLVLEKHVVPGGFATNFLRTSGAGIDYEFDTALHGIGGLENGALSGMVKDLDLNLYKKSEVFCGAFGSVELKAPNDPDEYLTYLVKKYPKDAKGIKEFFEFISVENATTKNMQTLSKMSISDFLNKYISNQDVVNEICGLWIYFGVPPKKMNAFYYLEAWRSFVFTGTYYIQGGSQKLSDEFVRKIRENGSEVLLRQEVTCVEVKDDEIKSVTTKKGEVYTADYFVLNASTIHVLKDLVDNKTDKIKNFLKELPTEEYGFSLTQAYLGLDINPSELGMNHEDYFYSSTYDLEVQYENIFKEGIDDTFGITNYSMMNDDLRDKKGYGIVAITIPDTIGKWPQRRTKEYKEQKEQYLDFLIAETDKKFPGFAKHVVVKELATPRTMERYTNNPNGAVYGFDQNLTNTGLERNFDFGLTNTFVASAWGFPGGGFEGAMIGGDFSAKYIDAKLEEDKYPDNPFTSKMLINGLCNNYIKNSCKEEVNVLFILDDEKFIVNITPKKAKIVPTADHINLEIISSLDVWSKISRQILPSQVALMKNEYQIKGDFSLLYTFEDMFQLLDEEKGDVEVITPSFKTNPTILMGLSFVPWIAFWVLSSMHFIGLETVMLIALILLAIIQPIRPTRIMSNFDIVTFIILVLGLLGIKTGLENGEIINYINFALPITFLVSCIINRPFSMDFSKAGFPKTITGTKLFLTINKKVTIAFMLVLFIQAFAICFFGPALGSIASALFPVAILYTHKLLKSSL